MNNRQGTEWIKVKRVKNKISPSEIRINMDGTVYIDDQPYDENNSKYGNLTIDVEMHNKLNTGEETQIIIDSSKKAKRGETVVIKDIKSPDKKESTTVKF